MQIQCARASKNCSRSGRLFEAECLPVAEHRNGLAQALFPGFLTFGQGNPADISTPVRRGQRLERLPRMPVLLQRFLNVASSLGARQAFGRWTVDDGTALRTPFDARRSKSTGGPQRRIAFQIGGRPRAVGPARRELLRVAIGVYALDKAVDPSITQRFVERIVIRDGWFAGVLLVKDEPDLRLGCMMLREPCSPPPERARVKGLQEKNASR